MEILSASFLSFSILKILKTCCFSKRLNTDTSIQVVPVLSLKRDCTLTVIHAEEHLKYIKKKLISGLLLLQTPLKFDSFQENTFYCHYRLKWIFIILLRKGVSFLQVSVFVTNKSAALSGALVCHILIKRKYWTR